MIVCLGTTPAVQRAMIFNGLAINGVNRAVEVLEAAAGKSVNVAKVLRVLGKDVVATGFLGGDRGDCLRTQLAAAGIGDEFIAVEPRTRMCVTVIDRAAHTHTELIEESRGVAPEAFDALLAKLRALLPQTRMLTLSGTLTPGAPADFYAQCTRLAAGAGVPTIIDAQGRPLKEALAARPAVVKPNRGELAATLGMAVDSEPAIGRAMAALMELGAGSVVTTLGGDGAIAADAHGCWRIRVPAIDVVNTIGSGDAFTAGLAAALVDGADLPEACRLAAACGAANALTLLAGDARIEDVRRIQSQIVVERVGAP